MCCAVLFFFNIINQKSLIFKLMYILKSNRFKGTKVDAHYTSKYETFNTHSPFKKPLVVSKSVFQ